MASCTWSDEETFVLIEIWGEDSIQAMLEGTRRNKDVFVKIAKAIEERGFLRAILYTYYGIPLRMRKYTHSAPFYVGNPFGLCKCERVLERFWQTVLSVNVVYASTVPWPSPRYIYGLRRIYNYTFPGSTLLPRNNYDV